jgi:hypothetical protein
MILYKRVLIMLFILLALSTTLMAGWGGLKYDNYASHISSEIDRVFIKYNLCKDIRRDCQEKQLFFMNQAEPKIQVMVNSIENYKIINEIITIVIDEFELSKKNGDKDLTIYLSFSRKNEKQTGFFSSLFNDDDFIELELKLQGEEK